MCYSCNVIHPGPSPDTYKRPQLRMLQQASQPAPTVEPALVASVAGEPLQPSQPNKSRSLRFLPAKKVSPVVLWFR